MIGGQHIFIRIRDADEKDSIMKLFLKSRQKFLAKSTSSSDWFQMIIEDYDGKQIQCSLDGALPENMEDISMISLMFTTGGEKYLAQCNFTKGKRHIINLDIKDIFQLQRREDFRLRMPIAYKAIFQVKEVNGTPVNFECKISDLSAGGMRFENDKKNHELKGNDELKGDLLLGPRPPLNVSATLKHVGGPQEKPNLQTVGSQFSGLSNISKNRIAAVVMDLYRELYSRLS